MMRSVRCLAWRSLLLVLAIAAMGFDARAQQADTVAPVFRRAQRLVNDGLGVAGRALVDSVLDAAPPGTPEEAEALWWRATLAESWESAQRDYLRLMLEFERSARAGDAMLRLAQFEIARGDREGAVRYLERLDREAPTSRAREESVGLRRRLGMSEVAAAPIPIAPPSDVAPPVTRPTTTRPAAPVRPDTQPATPSSAPAVAAVPAPAVESAPTDGLTKRWSFQVAAFNTLAEAERLATRLRAKRYPVRVFGTAAPFRVRIGDYATREVATQASAAYKSAERGATFVVEREKP